MDLWIVRPNFCAPMLLGEVEAEVLRTTPHERCLARCLQTA